jgi:hypothetical protein
VTPERVAVGQAQRIVSAVLVSGLALAAVAVFLGPQARFPVLVLPAALIGLVSPVIGFRIPLWIRDRMAAQEPAAGRCATYVRATACAVAVGDAAAIAGSIAYVVSGEPISLVGVATLVLLAGAIWPNEERVRAFVESPGSPR